MSPLFWVGVLAVSAFLLALVSAIVTFRVDSPADLKSRVRALDRDLTDLDDRVEKWRGRDSLRKMRAGQLEAAAVAQVPQRGTPEYKLFLRQRARGGNTGGAS